MFTIDEITNENDKDHKKIVTYFRSSISMLITGGSGSRKTNALLNLRTGKYTESLINEI